MAVQIYNTLTRKKDELKEKKLGIYVCGPTVYDEAHIGHARSAYVFDCIIRYLRYRKIKVTFVRNVTDIDDKIINKARQESGTESLKDKVKKIAEKYLTRYHEDMARLGLMKPDIEPKATDLIDDMIKFIQILIKRDYAYESSGNVYFNVQKFENYGQLSHRSLDQMQEGARVAPDETKRDPLDFALWKKSKAEEPSWPSPWGEGRPGWHIECSVMSTKYLKNNFLIHGGGLDLIFPHHENEIAQTVCTGKKSAKYWIHNGLLTINGQKMSKSLGNYITVKDILEKHHPEALKRIFLVAHYRSPVDFTYEKIATIAEAHKSFYELFDRIDETIKLTPPLADGKAILWKQIKRPEDYKKHFIEAMDNDFNMPVALGYLHSIRTGVNTMIDYDRWDKDTLAKSKEILLELGGIFGLFEHRQEVKLTKIQEKKIEERDLARKNGDYEKSDRIRQELYSEGIILKDTKTGTKCRKKG